MRTRKGELSDHHDLVIFVSVTDKDWTSGSFKHASHARSLCAHLQVSFCRFPLCHVRLHVCRVHLQISFCRCPLCHVHLHVCRVHLQVSFCKFPLCRVHLQVSLMQDSFMPCTFACMPCTSACMPCTSAGFLYVGFFLRSCESQAESFESQGWIKTSCGRKRKCLNQGIGSSQKGHLRTTCTKSNP
jgi:hypothetical protein